MNRGVYLSAVVAGLLFASSFAVRAQPATTNDALDVPAGAISLSEAARIAEGHAKGRATRAELERTRHGVVYDVEVVTDSAGVFDVAVDPATGKVLSSQADAADNDDGTDAAD